MGIQFPRQLPYDAWLGIGRQLAAASSSSAWCLGDWLMYGEEAYSGRYRDAIEQTSLDYQTLRNYVWVARRFAPSRRRDGLSFAHHAEVAGLAEHEQDFWLHKAEEFSWSRNRLRREVRASLAERAAADDQGEARASLGVGHAGDAGRGARAGDRGGPPCAAPPPPALPDAPDVPIQVSLSPRQLQSCRAAADRLGRSIEEWAAFALDRAAREELSGGLATVGPTVASARRTRSHPDRP
jgi:hypothetical protein